MTKLKLGPIPQDKPVKVTLELPVNVHRDLVAYPKNIEGRVRRQGQPSQLQIFSDIGRDWCRRTSLVGWLFRPTRKRRLGQSAEPGCGTADNNFAKPGRNIEMIATPVSERWASAHQVSHTLKKCRIMTFNRMAQWFRHAAALLPQG